MTTAAQAQPEATAMPAAGGTPLLDLLSFGILGALTVRHISADPLVIAAGAGVAAVAPGVWLLALGWLLALVDPNGRRRYGYRGIRAAIARGYVMMIPFTMLALAADLSLGWNAVAAFTSAGIMTSAAMVGAELAGHGGGRLRSALLPALWAFGLTMIWMIAPTAAAVALGGAQHG